MTPRHLTRYAVLRRYTPLHARATLSPRRVATIGDWAVEKIARDLVTTRAGGVCEVCGTCAATSFQHRRNRSQGGLWSASNGLAVCGSGNYGGCHGRIHQHPTQAMRKGWMVSRQHNPVEVPVWLCRIGLVFLDDAGDYRSAIVGGDSWGSP